MKKRMKEAERQIEKECRLQGWPAQRVRKILLDLSQRCLVTSWTRVSWTILKMSAKYNYDVLSFMHFLLLFPPLSSMENPR